MPPWVPTAWPCQRQRPWPSGHSPCHPERPTSPKAQMPPLSCSPPPASGGHGAAGGGISPSHAQRPPHSSPEGSGWPHLSGERSLPTQPLSCPYTHGWEGVHRSPAGVPAPRSKQEERDKVGSTGAITAAPAQIWAGGHRAGGCLGSGVMAGAPVRPGSGGSRSPCQGPGVDGDSKKIPAKRGSRCGGVASRAAPPPLGSALNGGGGTAEGGPPVQRPRMHPPRQPRAGGPSGLGLVNPRSRSHAGRPPPSALSPGSTEDRQPPAGHPSTTRPAPSLPWAVDPAAAHSTQKQRGRRLTTAAAPRDARTTSREKRGEEALGRQAHQGCPAAAFSHTPAPGRPWKPARTDCPRRAAGRSRSPQGPSQVRSPG